MGSESTLNTNGQLDSNQCIAESRNTSLDDTLKYNSLLLFYYVKLIYYFFFVAL
jgi:hypothetical protein